MINNIMISPFERDEKSLKKEERFLSQKHFNTVVGLNMSIQEQFTSGEPLTGTTDNASAELNTEIANIRSESTYAINPLSKDVVLI